MATVDEVKAQIEALKADNVETAASLSAIDSKLDEIATFILTLSAPASQEQLDELSALVDAAKVVSSENVTKAASVLAETDALDEPKP